MISKFSLLCLLTIGFHLRHCTAFSFPPPNIHNDNGSFFIRPVQEEDLGAAANILADSFSGSTPGNFFSQRIDRMNAYLSLKSRFETFRYAERSGALQCMLVAITTLDNKVVAFCEVDNRPPGGEINPAPRPYISNLAVAEEFRRHGSATALVSESEEIVRKVWGIPRLHLRVKEDNLPAKALYSACGYEVMESNNIDANADTEVVLLLGKLL